MYPFYNIKKQVQQHWMSIVILLGICFLMFKLVVRTMPLEDSLPLWNIASATWFNITISKVKEDMNNYDVGTINFDQETFKRVRNNYREGYRTIAHFLSSGNGSKLEHLFKENSKLKRQGKLAVFQKVVISSDGWIVDENKPLAVRNGGCYSPDNLFIRTVFVPKYEKVISIAVFWGHGIWHFPMESLVGLYYMTDEEIKSSYIHVTSRNKWVLRWLKLAGIHEEKVIDGTIYAKTLIVPETAGCGSPHGEQIQWMKKFIVQRTPVKRNSLLLIKRTRKRVIPNFNELENVVKEYAKLLNLRFVIHDDSSLPSFEEQSRRFAEAVIVIGPHGAGLVHLLSSEVKTCVVEFLPTDLNLCYMRLSYLLGHYYFSVPLYSDQSVKLDDVQKALTSCLRPQA